MPICSTFFSMRILYITIPLTNNLLWVLKPTNLIPHLCNNNLVYCDEQGLNPHGLINLISFIKLLEFNKENTIYTPKNDLSIG